MGRESTVLADRRVGFQETHCGIREKFEREECIC